MDGSSSIPRPEELAAHEAWLRALARQLVGPADADDAVQEAFLAALRSPPPAGRPLRPWLGRVMRNAVKMRWREGARRTRRELAAEPPAGTAAPDELVERARARELVARLVLELDEAERQALLLRYGEGASAADIARALGVPAGTVRWRLSRAIASLRERLDAESGGDRRAWQLALAPLAAAPDAATHAAIAATAKGALAMKTKTIAAFAAVGVVGISGALVYVSRAEPGPAAATPAQTAATPTPGASAKTAGAAPAKPAAEPARAPDDERARQRARHAELLARIEDGLARRERERESRRRAHRPAGGTRERPALKAPPLDREYIQQAMQEIKPLVVECYTMALERDPALAGRAKVTFSIAGDEDVGGVVAQSDFEEEGSTMADPLFAECIQETMYALELPPPTGGGQVTVTYPFVFRPDGAPEP